MPLQSLQYLVAPGGWCVFRMDGGVEWGAAGVGLGAGVVCLIYQ